MISWKSKNTYAKTEYVLINKSPPAINEQMFISVWTSGFILFATVMLFPVNGKKLKNFATSSISPKNPAVAEAGLIWFKHSDIFEKLNDISFKRKYLKKS